MESRKLIRSGPSSLVISLPSWWIKDNNLTKGMSVDIDLQDNNLILIPKTENKKDIPRSKKKKYYLKGNEQYIIKEELIYCFLNNVDEIEVPLDKVNIIKPLLNKIPGSELRIHSKKAKIYNFLDKRKIKVMKELKHCLKNAKEIFQKIPDLDKEEDTYEQINLLKNLIRRLMIAESFVNGLITNAELRSRSHYTVPELVKLKQMLKEVPILLKHEIKLITTVMYYKNANTKTLFTRIEDYFDTNLEFKESKIAKTITQQIKMKHEVEKLTNSLVQVQDKKEVMVVDGIISILHSLRRLSSIRRPLI